LFNIVSPLKSKKRKPRERQSSKSFTWKTLLTSDGNCRQLGKKDLEFVQFLALKDFDSSSLTVVCCGKTGSQKWA